MDPVELQVRPPLVERFLDAFLQPRNIKWVLLAGTLILLASSLMLVTAHWERYTPVWKHLILLSYTGAVFVAGEWTYRKMALRRTGTILLSLSVLLLPVTFAAVHLVTAGYADDGGVVGGAIGLGATRAALLALNLALAVPVASRVFRHFLRRPQPTFLGSYLILCVAGAIVPVLGDSLAPWAAVVLWAVFTVGVVKVNRHVFWLVEEHRAPRIFGFFPIALLGAQFLWLFALALAPHASLPWWGLACAAVAMPVLLTADAVAAGFQQRTGDLVRPLPWAIIGPLVVGLVLSAAGVCLAGAGLMHEYTAHAIVPTAALVAAMLARNSSRSRTSWPRRRRCQSVTTRPRWRSD